MTLFLTCESLREITTWKICTPRSTGGTPSIKLPQKSSNESLELRTVKVDTLKEPKTQVTKAKIPNVVPVRTTSFLMVYRWAIAPIAIRAYPTAPSHWLSKKR